MITDPERSLAGKVQRTRLAMLWERAWEAAFPAVMVAGIAALIFVTGVPALLPPALKLVFIGVAALVFIVSLWPLTKVRIPDDAEALHRIESVSGVKHRPGTTFRDHLADPAAGPQSQMIWQEHQSRMAALLSRLKAVWPRSRLAVRDPHALRNALAIALIAAVALNASQWKTRVAEAVSTLPQRPSTTSLDAWVVPPAYTQKPPLLLTGPAAEKRQAEDGEFLVPEGSTLVVRLNGATDPKLSLMRFQEDGSAGEEFAAPPLAANTASGVHEGKTVLERPALVALTDGGRKMAEWRISILPDAPPEVSIEGNIAVTPTGGFALQWRARDDYGVAGIRANFRLAEKAKRQEGKLLYDPPTFNVNLPRLNPRDARGRAFQDLTAHPWAGLEVELRLEAKDQANQTGISEALTFKLPERRFRKLLARALVEQRRNLVRAPDERQRVVRALSALMAWPEGLIDKSGVYLGIRSAAAKLYQAKKVEQIKEVVDLLWQIAVTIEDGDLSEALKELESLRKELQQALAEGAPPEKIAELMDKLREALDRYLEAMNRQLMEALRKGELQPRMSQGREIAQQDLKRMLDTIENLAKSGARDAAQELLSQLENLLRNLQPGLANRGDQQRDTPMGRMLQELGELMRRQQQLMDETFRLPEGMQEGMGQQEEGQEPGMQGNRGKAEGLAGQQGALGRMLEDLMRQLGEQGLEAPSPLGRARRSMEGAADALRQMQRDPALGRQGEALESLREGAQAMARQLMQQGTGNEGNYGRHGEAGGDDRDPLGRPMPQRGEDYGPERDMLPSEAAIERARRILDALRTRANERTRPRLELDYIDRLLRGLY